MHDVTKVLMGTTKSSERTVVPHKGVYAAGLAVRRKNDGTLSVTSTDGDFYGVSLGRDLSNGGYSSICIAGLGVPLKLTDGYDPAIGAVVSTSNSTGLGASSGTATAATYAEPYPGAGAVTARVGGSGNNTAGQAEDGTFHGVAYIDMVGGL